jgi:transcriptional regulator GlxA family with amidase domain
MTAALVAFDRMTALDFVGFYDPVTRLASMGVIPDFRFQICASTPGVVDDRGLRVQADAVDGALDGYDLLFVPGGYGTEELQHDRRFIEWLRGARPVPLKVSVCTGALLLGAAGFLEGRRATTHPTAYAELAPYCGQVVAERVVDEGDVITGRGVSSAIDLGLHVVERLAGPAARERIATQMDYPCRRSLAGDRTRMSSAAHPT